MIADCLKSFVHFEFPVWVHVLIQVVVTEFYGIVLHVWIFCHLGIISVKMLEIWVHSSVLCIIVGFGNNPIFWILSRPSYESLSYSPVIYDHHCYILFSSICIQIYDSIESCLDSHMRHSCSFLIYNWIWQ